MSEKVVVIGLDSADSKLIKRWVAKGYLKNFGRLLSTSAYTDVRSRVNYRNDVDSEECATTEVLWTTLLTGCKPQKTGYWSITEYSPKNYGIRSSLTNCSYDYQECPLFYALGDQYDVAALNIPSSAISERVNGIQLLGWAGHYPGVPQASEPPEILASVIEKYGENPILFKDDGIWWDQNYIDWERQALNKSIQSQSKLFQDYLVDQPWNLFFGVFSDLHTAGHDLYAHSEFDHPLSSYLKTGLYETLNPLRDAYQEIDRALGEIMTRVSDDTYLLIVSPHGIGPNYSDLLSHLFLPELLNRYSFPGKTAIPGQIHEPLNPPKTHTIRNGWTAETWISLPESNVFKDWIKTWTPRRFLTADCRGLKSPFSLDAQKQDHSWMPAMWYHSLWPQMKAFALPGFANGQIRINLQGREAQGIVPLCEYEAVCDEITSVLSGLTDGRTGCPIVKKVVRTRHSGTEENPKLPHPDLIVYWNDMMTDVVDSPEFGRIGPVTYSRTGTHREAGFMTLQGPGIEPGTYLPTTDIADIAPTILDLMQAPVPDHFDGQSLLRHGLLSNATSMMP